jgi:hypothetical protein
MHALISSIIFAFAANHPVAFTNSRVMADYSIHITSSRVGNSIYIGECRGFEEGSTLLIRFVDTASEADISGYLVDNPDRADHVFCTS